MTFDDPFDRFDPFDRARRTTTMRASDTEREQAADALRRHHAEGRLSDAEFEQRVARGYAARTRGELEQLFADLPRGERHPVAAAGGWGELTCGRRPHMIALAFAVVAVLSVVHWLLFATAGPWHGGPPILLPLLLVFAVWRFGLRRGRRQVRDGF